MTDPTMPLTIIQGDNPAHRALRARFWHVTPSGYAYKRPPSDPRLTPDAILAIRARRGLSQTAFGELLGVNQVTVSRWECGAFSPGARTAPVLLALLDGDTGEAVAA